jgi:hypothetical protein
LLLGHALDSTNAIGVGYNKLIVIAHPQVKQPHVACWHAEANTRVIKREREGERGREREREREIEPDWRIGQA